MSSTETEAPSEVKPKRTMSDAQKAALAAGRARALAEKKKLDEHVASATMVEAIDRDPRDAEIERLKAELARRPPLPTKSDVAALPLRVCYFEFVRSATPEGAPIAERIDSPDDPRWAELDGATTNVFGSLITERIYRDEDEASRTFGQEISRTQIRGFQPKKPHIALAQMRSFAKTGAAHMSDDDYSNKKPYGDA